MNTYYRFTFGWLIPSLVVHFTSCDRHVMDELTFSRGIASDRSARNKLESLTPVYANDAILDEELLLVLSGATGLPTPTDVPVPTPRDVPVPDPIDIPPPEPHDIPPPKPEDPVVDPQPRPIP